MITMLLLLNYQWFQSLTLEQYYEYFTNLIILIIIFFQIQEVRYHFYFVKHNCCRSNILLKFSIEEFMDFLTILFLFINCTLIFNFPIYFRDGSRWGLGAQLPPDILFHNFFS